MLAPRTTAPVVRRRPPAPAVGELETGGSEGSGDRTATRQGAAVPGQPSPGRGRHRAGLEPVDGPPSSPRRHRWPHSSSARRLRLSAFIIGQILRPPAGHAPASADLQRPARRDQPARGSTCGCRAERRWWTHGLPPKSGTVTTDAAQRLAAIGGTGRHDFRAGWTGRRATRGPRTAGRRGSRGAGARQQPSRARGRGLGPSDSPATGADVWLDQPPHARSAPALAARPGRTGFAPPPRHNRAHCSNGFG